MPLALIMPTIAEVEDVPRPHPPGPVNIGHQMVAQKLSIIIWRKLMETCFQPTSFKRSPETKQSGTAEAGERMPLVLFHCRGGRTPGQAPQEATGQRKQQ